MKELLDVFRGKKLPGTQLNCHPGRTPCAAHMMLSRSRAPGAKCPNSELNGDAASSTASWEQPFPSTGMRSTNVLELAEPRK